MMFLRDIIRDEQAETGGEGGGGASDPPDMKEEFTAILDKMESDETGEEVDESPAGKPVAAVEDEASADDDSTPEESPEVTVSDEDNWLTDDLRERAKNYHFTEEMMLAQGSPEDVEANMLLIDNYQQRQMELQQAAYMAANPQQPPVIDPLPETGEVPPEGAAPPQQMPPGMAPPPGFEFKDFTSQIEELVTEGYDAPLTDLQRGMAEQQKMLHQHNQMLEQRMMQMEQHAMQVQQGAVQNHQNRVLTMVDNLGRDDLFGTADEFTPEQAANTEKVNSQLEYMMRHEGYALNPSTVKTAYQRVFSDQLVKEATKNKFNKVQNQSRKRMGRGATATPREDLDWDGDITDDPVLLAAGRKMMREANGY